MSKSKSVEPARHSASTVKILIHMFRSISFEPARHSSCTTSSTPKLHINVIKIKIRLASLTFQLNSQLNSKNTYTSLSKSKSTEPARHSISRASLTAKILDSFPLSQLEIPAQTQAYQ